MPFINWLLDCELSIRSGAESADSKLQGVLDSDSVELEKSNVLLMGPTGSGRINIHIYVCFVLFFVGTSCSIKILLYSLWFFALTKDREDVTCKNTSSCRECAVCHCWWYNINTGKCVARSCSTHDVLDVMAMIPTAFVSNVIVWKTFL